MNARLSAAEHDLDVLRDYRRARAHRGPLETTRNVALAPEANTAGEVRVSFEACLESWLCNAYHCDRAHVVLGVVAHGQRGPWSASFAATLTWESDEELGFGERVVEAGGHAEATRLLGLVRRLQAELEGKLDLEGVSLG